MAKLTILDDNEEKSRWFPFDEDTEVKIKYLDRRALRKINEKSAKAGRLSGESSADYSNCLLGRTAVQGWRKINDHNHPGLIVKGHPLSFSRENLDLLMSKSLEFSRFVNEVCTDASAFEVEGDEEIKND